MSSVESFEWCDSWRSSSQVRILSVDGGGVRGIIPSCGLIKIEKKLKAKKSTVHDAFDWFIGTSTGSIVTAALLSGYSPKEIRNIYRKRASEIFPDYCRLFRTCDQRLILKPLRFGGLLFPKHGDRGLNKVLKDAFRKRTLGEIKEKGKRLLVVTYSTGSSRPFIFDSDSDALSNVPLWEICRASCAAPTYLPEHEMTIDDGEELTLIDGGTVANNPSAIAIANVMACRMESESAFVVSLGTGVSDVGYSSRRWFKLGGMLPWSSLLVQTFMSGSNRTFEEIAHHLLKCDGNHYRFDVPLSLARCGIDIATRYHINALEQDARKYWTDVDISQRLSSLTDRLDSRRRPDLSFLAGEWCSEYSTANWNKTIDQQITIEVVGGCFLKGRSRPEDSYPGSFEAGIAGAGKLVGQWYNPDKSRASAFVFDILNKNQLIGNWIGHSEDRQEGLTSGRWNMWKRGTTPAPITPPLQMPYPFT